MLKSDETLLRWAGKGKRPDVTLGQLVTLLDLSERESVAAMADGNVTMAVNFRQKLDRLEKALAIGRLTKRTGKTTQVTETGMRLAGEVRLLLVELTRDAGRSSRGLPSWVFGAGDTWLQSVVIPTLARWPQSARAAQWEVANVRNHVLCESLLVGKIHFGLMRRKDLPEDHGLRIVKTYSGAGISLLVSGAPALSSGIEAINWAIESAHPLIQQGTTWRTICASLIDASIGDRRLAAISPTVVCETHPQAAGSVINGRGWTIVPSIVARNVNRADVQVHEIVRSQQTDELALLVCERVLEKLNGGREAAESLKREIGLTIAGAKR